MENLWKKFSESKPEECGKIEVRFFDGKIATVTFFCDDESMIYNLPGKRKVDEIFEWRKA